MAAGDLEDVDLIRMKKFFEVQMFLKYLLKEKMQKLKNYYEPYEIAFLKIKSQTVNFFFILERKGCSFFKSGVLKF